ncbi:hypothetical protein BU204_10040 [Actinophytocola xanthii]|uniref:Uncharacterized protein n=1 Tax=Actinophytocola xanthii TaxID=1912961 RepID=A0A1Q8CU21_9PSEU|nr:hypothetical protein BU204_10040 [Actinophytocola xanthii]
MLLLTGLVTPPAPNAAEVVEVHDAASLRIALREAGPGDQIRMASGVYNGRFIIEVDGTSGAPITLTGPRNAVIDGGGTASGRVVTLQADHWRLSGFTVTNGQKGIMALGANHTVLERLRVHHIGDEAVHFRDNSSDNVVRDSEISDTGLREPGFGEGVYFGQAVSNWVDGRADRSDRNAAVGNHFGPNVRAEAVDVKEGTTGGQVRGNTFDGTGMTGANYADSWVDLKGNGYLVADNRGTRALRDGFQTGVMLDGWGRGNTFRGNTADVRGPGYGFNIKLVGGDPLGNVVCSNNVVTGAASGVANIARTSC